MASWRMKLETYCFSWKRGDNMFRKMTVIRRIGWLAACLALFAGALSAQGSQGNSGQSPSQSNQQPQQNAPSQQPPAAPEPQPSSPITPIQDVTAPPTGSPSNAPAIAPTNTPPAVEPKGTVIEEVVARVNNDVITTVDLEHSRASMLDDIRQSCSGCSEAQIDAEYNAKLPDVLRDLIDQSLLVQRAKDMDINVESDVVKKLDEIRQENHIDTMEDLEAKIEAAGIDFEDYKNNIRTQLLTQQVIRQEVGERIIISHEEVQKYYNDHPDEFTRPEQVVLREIFISTENKPDSDIPALRKKADTMLDRVHNGDDFGELAKHFSDSSTAPQNGELGTFQRGQLAPAIEDKVFKMNRNDVTDVIETKTGFLILQVEQHYAAGLQPLDKVENEVEDKLYSQKMEPALRDYLKQLRQDSYVQVKPGYTDTAGVPSTSIEEVSPTTDEEKQKKGRRRFWVFGKRKTVSSSSS